MNWRTQRIGPIHLLTVIIFTACLVYGMGLGLMRQFESLALMAIAAWTCVASAWVELTLRIWPSPNSREPHQNDVR